MDLHYLELFNTIAECLSYRKASEILHISQPAISIQIKKLESQTSLKLFYKCGNKIYLTEGGLILYGYTRKIFSIIKEMESSISNISEYIGGTINLGGSNTPGTYILPAVVGEMKKHFPSVTINLHIANTSEITTLIDNGTLDVAINGGNCNYNPYISVEKLFDDRLVIIAALDNKLCAKECITIEDLSEESFIVHEKTSQLYTCYKILIDELKISKNIGMFLGSIDAIKHAVSANLGISFIPYCAVQFEIEKGMLKELKLESLKFDYPYNIIYNKNKNISFTTQKFIEVLKDMYTIS